MAAYEVNKSTRKRKSEIDLVFEVDEAECSPISNPELVNSDIIDNFTVQTDIKIEKSQNDNSNLESEKYSENMLLNKENIKKVFILSDDVNLKPIECNNTDKRNFSFLKIENKETNNSSLKKLLFSIKFNDEEFAKLYEKVIVNTIMGLFDFNLKVEIDESNFNIHFLEEKASSDMDIVDEESNKSTCDDNISNKLTENFSDNLFVVDTTPGSKVNNENQPKYLPRFKYNAIDESRMNDSSLSKIDLKQCVRQNNCFNCGGQHALKDCKEPRDYKRIQTARNSFKTLYKTIRYHLDEEQKYGHCVPGKISDNLRVALNIGKHEIPNHVYHMRRIGYSPGWLEMAKITKSNIKLFDFHGSSISNSSAQESIDGEKIIEYPGFNKPLEKGFKDNYRERGCPAYNKNHSKAAMLLHIKKTMLMTDPVLKNVLTDQVVNSPSNEILSPPCCESDSNSHEIKVTYNGCQSRENSPSLTDLEMKKKQILDMLNDGGITSSPQTPLIQEELNKSIVENFNNLIKSSAYGTPILKNCSPYESLPCSEKFSKDISQVINFENLPNSTGKYEQMSQVINKIRKSIRYSFEEKLS